MNNSTKPLFVYFKSPLEYSEPIRRIKVIKPIRSNGNIQDENSTNVDTFENFVLSVGKEFIIINLSEFFPIPDLLNRCINFEIHPLSLTNILNVLYSIDYWLHIPSSYLFLHCLTSSFDSYLIMACYFLWKYTGDLTSIAYQDVLLNFVRLEKEDITVDQIPHTVMSTLHSFYCVLCDNNHTLNLNKVLELRNCQIFGLFFKDHSDFPKIPVLIVGKGNKILFSSKSDQDCVIWNPQIGELIVICTIQIQGDFYISCYGQESDIGCNPPLFQYCSHTGFIDDNINDIVGTQMDVNPSIEEGTLSLTLLSSKEITRSIPIPSCFEMLFPPVCRLRGLRQLVTHHALQLEMNKREELEREVDEERRLLLHLFLLLFDGDSVRAVGMMKGVEVSEDLEGVEVKFDDLKGSGDGEDVKGKVKVDNFEGEKLDNLKGSGEVKVVNLKGEKLDNLKKPGEDLKEGIKLDDLKKGKEKEIPKTTSLKEDEQINTPEKSNDTTHTSRPGATFKKETVVRGRKGVFLRYHPDYKDFFDWWLEDGIDKETVENAIQSEGLDPSVLSRNIREIVAVDDVHFVFWVDETSPLKDSFFYFMKRRNHPRFAKYFNKLEVGSCTEEEVRKLMVKDGVEPSVLELDQHEWIELE